MLFEQITIKEVKKELAELCKQQRKLYGLSQEDLGEALGLSRFTIQKFENGQNATLDTVLKIVHHFDLLERLFEAIKALQSENNNTSMY